MTPQEFAQRLNRLYAGTMMQDIEMVHAGEGRARGRGEFKPHLRQLTGLFHAGVIMGLADTTATAAAMWEVDSKLALERIEAGAVPALDSGLDQPHP
jgi:acyl-coenzyme A thioesterase PaaI-like protein